jgi:hypothetical protein
MSEVWLNRAALFGIAGALLGAIGRLTIADLDMFHQMGLFREALATGWVPRIDVFSYVPTVIPLVHHEWGAGAVLYLVTVTSGLGATGLMILKYTLSAAVAVGCFIYARRRGASVPIFAWLSPLGINLGWIGFTTIRAQLFTLSFLVVLLLFLEEDRRGRRWWIAAWLPMYVIWLNLHGGFVVGVGLVSLYALEGFVMQLANRKPFPEAFQQVKHLVGVGLAMVLLVMVNPYGWEYVPYLWRAFLLDRSLLIAEWRPLWQAYQPVIVLSLFGLSLAIVVYSTTQRGVRNCPGILFLLVTAWLALWHLRHLSIYALVWMGCTPAYVEETKLAHMLRKIWEKRKTLLFSVWITLGFLGTLWACRYQFWQLRIPTTMAEEKEVVLIYPSGAIKYLANQRFTGNVMVPFNAGSYVSWKLYPQVKVSMDSRYEAAYPVEAVVENARFYQAKEGWQETLARYPTNAVLVPRSSPLDELIEKLNQPTGQGKCIDWRRVYVDDGFSLFVRTELADHLPVLDRRGKPIPVIFP